MSTDPKVAQRVTLATKQLLIDYGPLEEGKELWPSTADGQKELRQLFNNWIDAINSSETVEGQPPPPPSRAVHNVSIFECPSLLLEFDSANSKSQFEEMIEKNNFLLKELSPKAHICPRTYVVIFRFVPCDGSFDPNKEDHLCDIKKDNDLQANSIFAALWCKQPDRRSPGQTTATLKVACTNLDVTNSLLTGRIRVADHLVHVRKDLRIPIRCIRCQEYGHIQDTCIGVDRCSNCSSEFHQADKCDSAPSCISCRAGSKHPSTSPCCPTFLRKCEALDGRFPENAMPYYPSKGSWTWAATPANPPPPPPQEANAPRFQQANPDHRSIRPQRQKSHHKEVRFEDPPSASQAQACQVDDGWSTVRWRQSSPQRHQCQATITDIWGT